MDSWKKSYHLELVLRDILCTISCDNFKAMCTTEPVE